MYISSNCNIKPYIGETKRSFEVRIIDHNKCDRKSYFYKYYGENSRPHFWLDNF